MARTSSSRRSSVLSSLAALSALLLLGTISLGLAGCGNDNPADSGGSMTVDLRGIKSQLGGGFSTQATGVDGSPATTAVQSLIIGAVVITFSDTPLSETTPITPGIEDKFASDVINSINFFTIVDLPTDKDFVEFKVPPPGAGKWQVAAVGTKNRITTFEDLNDSNVAIYYGFDPHFHSTSSGSQPDVTIQMNRACFIDEPPRGCAQYNPANISKPIGTATVKIMEVLRNGTPVVGPAGLPYSKATDDATVVSQLQDVVTANPGLLSTAGDVITVVTMHQDDPAFIFHGCSVPNYVQGSGTLADFEADPCYGLFKTKL